MGTARQDFRISLVTLAALLTAVTIAPQVARAQTPAQIEYDRQQREYWRQQEQQRQEQQLQQQQMNENTRRQQEQMKQLNAPAGQGPTPGQGPTQRTPSGAPGGQALEESTDYVYRGNQRYQQHNVLWNVRVDVREGANNSVKLDQANLISIN